MTNSVIRNSAFLIVLMIVIVVPIIILTIFVGLLLSFHIYLILSGKTTKETISSKSKNEKKLEELKPTLDSPDLKVALFTGVDEAMEANDEKKPYLCFAMPLTKEEVDYLNSFELCYGAIMNL